MVHSNLKELMEKKGVTLKQMVKDTGLAEMTLIRARRDQIKACRLETLILMATYLNCKVEELFTLEKDSSPHNSRQV